jgi:hypothetical protein
LVGFCLVLFFPHLNGWDLWDPDEPRYGQVAREMVQGGDWILMHFNGATYNDKPPLFFWLIGLSSFLWQGFSSFSVRFPAALFGTLTVTLTFLLGRILYGGRTGFLAALILGTSYQFVFLATRANIDTTLTFFTTASLYCFFRWVRAGRRDGKVEPEDQGKVDRRGRWIYGFYGAMALATLAKGPVGFILPLMISLVFLAVERNWRAVREMRWFPGLALFLVMVLCWYLPAVLKGGREYLEATLLHHSAGRFARGTSHIRPFYYFFYNFPVDFLPWIFFLPGAVAYGFNRETAEKRREFLALFVWFVVIFLFFTVSKGKRGLYLLPLFPAASLMVGKLWNDFISGGMNQFKQGWVCIPLYVLAGVVVIAGLSLPWVAYTRFPSEFFHALSLALVLLGIGLALLWSGKGRHHGAAFFLITGMVFAGFLFTFSVIFPRVNPFKSARFLSAEIQSRIKPGEKVAVLGMSDTSAYNYYTGILPILELDGLESTIGFLHSESRVYCLLQDWQFKQLRTVPGTPFVEVIDQGRTGHRDFVLISNRRD